MMSSLKRRHDGVDLMQQQLSSQSGGTVVGTVGAFTRLRFSAEGVELTWCTSPDALLDVCFTLASGGSSRRLMCGDDFELCAVHICTY